MKCKKMYADKEKYRKYRNGYNSRYYARTQNAPNKRQRWTLHDMDMIIKREVSDTELSKLLGRSVRAIQMKRQKLKKEGAI